MEEESLCSPHADVLDAQMYSHEGRNVGDDSYAQPVHVDIHSNGDVKIQEWVKKSEVDQNRKEVLLFDREREYTDAAVANTHWEEGGNVAHVLRTCSSVQGENIRWKKKRKCIFKAIIQKNLDLLAKV